MVGLQDETRQSEPPARGDRRRRFVLRRRNVGSKHYRRSLVAAGGACYIGNCVSIECQFEEMTMHPALIAALIFAVPLIVILLVQLYYEEPPEKPSDDDDKKT